MALFTPAYDRSLLCDALLVDTTRDARVLAAEGARDTEPLAEALLDRAILMGKSLHEVREHTFALFLGRVENGHAVAVTGPWHDGAVSALRDVLGSFGEVREEGECPLARTGLFPFLAYERGRVSFLHTAESHPLLRAAGRRGVRIVAAAQSHAPDPDVVIA